MANITNDPSYVPRSKRKHKRGLFWRVIGTIVLVILLVGGGWLYGTNQGLQFRRELVGSVLATQHPQYVKYLRFLLSKSEFDDLYAAWQHPTVEQSNVDKEKVKPDQHIAKAAGLKSFSDSIIVDTVNTVNYTAKVLVIPDPTTIHVVTTQLTNKGQSLADLLKQNHAVAGINGGAFLDPGGNGSGGQMLGIVISKGKIISTPGGNNVAALVGAFRNDGEFITGNYSANQLLNLGVKEAISFGPQLIVNGKSRVSPALSGAWGWAPRTAIGQTANGRIVMIITDGRFYWDKTHRGASMGDMVSLFQKYDVINAIAMDGGGSTTMMKDDQLLMKPATNTSVGMRYLPDAWVVIPH